MAHILPPGISLQGAAYGLGISETARVIASRTASSAWSKRDTNDDGGVTVNDTEGSIAAPFDIQERGRSEGCGGSDVRVWKRSNPSRRMTVSARLEGTPLGLRLLGIFEVHGESRTMEVVTVATGQFCDWGAKKRMNRRRILLLLSLIRNCNTSLVPGRLVHVATGLPCLSGFPYFNDSKIEPAFTRYTSL
ncbi:hypothetical protein CPB85DRAFT_1309207 [Mucidula mucida]|nr:hypothetical protein CPB85DRAFT_1309207 [Mucidula mucida]